MKSFLKIILVLVSVFALIQLIPVSNHNPPVDARRNFIVVEHTPPEIVKIIQTSCYDCHSNETKYPSYSHIAPISWSMQHHISEGREHLNFSEWGNYNEDLKKSMLEHTISEITEEKMPMPGYIVYHPDAKLRPAEKKIVTDYFKSVLERQKN